MVPVCVIICDLLSIGIHRRECRVHSHFPPSITIARHRHDHKIGLRVNRYTAHKVYRGHESICHLRLMLSHVSKDVISCHDEDLGGQVEPFKALLAPLPVKVLMSTASTPEACASRNSIRRGAHAHQTRRHRATETRRRHRRRHGVLHHTCESRWFALLLCLEDVGNVRKALWVAHVWRKARRWASLWVSLSLVLDWWRLHEGEVRRELWLLLLLRQHARHTRMPAHATIRRWLLWLLRTFSKVASLLHLLLHEHGVLVESWRRTGGCALGRAATQILAWH